MCIRMAYEDSVGQVWQAWYGWSEEFDGNWEWDTYVPSYVSHYEIEQVSPDSWHEKKTQNIMDITPQPEEILWIRIGSYGWGWDTWCALPYFSEE